MPLSAEQKSGVASLGLRGRPGWTWSAGSGVLALAAIGLAYQTSATGPSAGSAMLALGVAAVGAAFAVAAATLIVAHLRAVGAIRAGVPLVACVAAAGLGEAVTATSIIFHGHTQPGTGVAAVQIGLACVALAAAGCFALQYRRARHGIDPMVVTIAALLACSTTLVTLLPASSGAWLASLSLGTATFVALLVRTASRVASQFGDLRCAHHELIEQYAIARYQADADRHHLTTVRAMLDEHTLFSVADASGKIIDVNEGFCRISGYTREELVGQDHRILNSGHHSKDFWSDMWRTIASGKPWRADVCNRRKDGSLYWVDSTNIPECDAQGNVQRYISLRIDITQKKLMEQQMRDMVQKDQLTDLASRGALLDRLELAIERTRRHGNYCAVLFFDFDRFKVVNDSLGHDVGDELLRSIGSRLKRSIRASDTAARFGGDEFVVLLEDLANPRLARGVAEKLLAVCAKPHDVGGHQLFATASIGLVTSEYSSGGAAGMLRDADAAMYQAKTNGRAQVVEFDLAMTEARLEELFVEAELRSAIGTSQFSLHYQPVIDLQTGRAVSAEALARWMHPDVGFISPGTFIPIAEDSNQINALGSWVIWEACSQIADWKRRGVIPEGFTVSVNVSKAQLLSPTFLDEVTTCVSRAGIQPHDLKLEVTETTIVANRTDVTQVLSNLRERGFKIMMDDFGTGHSSLSGLHRLPIDDLKIDQSFIRSEQATRELTAITSAIVTLANHLSMPTVGEGVETADHIALLQDLGCHFAQGYYFLKPAPVDAFEKWLVDTDAQIELPSRHDSAARNEAAA